MYLLSYRVSCHAFAHAVDWLPCSPNVQLKTPRDGALGISRKSGRSDLTREGNHLSGCSPIIITGEPQRVQIWENSHHPYLAADSLLSHHHPATEARGLVLHVPYGRIPRGRSLLCCATQRRNSVDCKQSTRNQAGKACMEKSPGIRIFVSSDFSTSNGRAEAANGA
jgi:hypothetical protein